MYLHLLHSSSSKPDAHFMATTCGRSLFETYSLMNDMTVIWIRAGLTIAPRLCKTCPLRRFLIQGHGLCVEGSAAFLIHLEVGFILGLALFAISFSSLIRLAIRLSVVYTGRKSTLFLQRALISSRSHTGSIHSSRSPTTTKKKHWSLSFGCVLAGTFAVSRTELSS